MKRAVLTYDGATVDTDDFAVGKHLGDEFHGLGILVWLMIGRTQHSIVHDEEVGIGGWQSLMVFIIDGARHWQFDKRIGLAVECPECF